MQIRSAQHVRGVLVSRNKIIPTLFRAISGIFHGPKKYGCWRVSPPRVFEGSICDCLKFSTNNSPHSDADQHIRPNILCFQMCSFCFLAANETRYLGIGGSMWKPGLLIIQGTVAAAYVFARFRFGPIGSYSASVCANDTKISKSSQRHGAIPWSKFSSQIKSRTALLKSLSSCSREHILSMLVKPPRRWGPYDFESVL